MAKGKDTKSMLKKEIQFMQRNKAPKSMIEHEKAEHDAMGYATGGIVRGAGAAQRGKRFTRAG